ncbi:glycosyltransferase family 2 protein [Actinoplanes subglobosus]|uniref:Glycosyltransferase family 2 protein n=1 Tax=Actinoplanes subglobosus TaxID=1547892 RepID=A0ABV8J7R4_9ACTN
MSSKVSVVVPVYNPGPYIDDCINSLIGQSLPADEYEICFVDDGSTDGTPARLDRLAGEHANVRVIHQEASGWSGRPRNVGIDATTGEYVMFVDNDDYLGPEALERMYAYGVAHDADVVVGKMAGKGRPVPLELFRENRPRATVRDAPLIDSLTPHKMVRRAFLDRIGLRFREGRRRLEDHVFVAEAYLRAGNIAVLSDYVCYYHVKRDDAGNAGFRPIEPVGYFGNLREALDVVDTWTEPGPLRDRLHRRWLRNEIVERLRGRRLLAMDPEYRREMFTEMRAVIERFGPGVAAGLPPIQRVVAALLADGRLGDLEELATWEAGLRPVGDLRRLSWEDGVLRAGFTVEYASDAGPLTFRRDETGISLAPPVPDGVAVRFEEAKVDLVVRERATAAEFHQPVTFEREEVGTADPSAVRLRLRAEAHIDPRTAAAGTRITGGIWDVFLRYRLSGWNRETRLGALRGPDAEAGRRLGVVDGQSVLPYWTDPHQNLSIDVRQSTGRLRYDLLGTRPEQVTAAPGRITVSLPAHVDTATTGLLRLTRAAARAPYDVDATVEPTAGGCVLTAVLTGIKIPPGRYRIAVTLGADAGDRAPTDLRLTLRVNEWGAMVVQSADDTTRPAVTRPGRRAPLVRRVLRGIRTALR